MEVIIPGEKARKLYDKRARPLAGLTVVGNGLSWNGLKNKVEKGPNLIVANHPGIYKDIGLLIALYQRQLFFLANKEIFTKKDFDKLIRNSVNMICKKNFPSFGLSIGNNFNFFSSALRLGIVKYVSSRIADVGSIPVSINGKNSNSGYKQIVEKYLLNNLAVVVMQPNKDENVSRYDKYNKEIKEFRYGASKIAYNMKTKYDLDIPVTPISIKGTSGFFFEPLGRIKVNIGEPIYISEKKYWEKANPVKNFKEGLEQIVVELYHDFK